MSGVSSVDPTAEYTAIKGRLSLLPDGALYSNVPQGFELPTDEFGNKKPYRDIEPGSVIRAASSRMLGVGEQAQPHIWGFQVHHYAHTRDLAFALANATNTSLIGWAPSSAAGPIGAVYFTVYDEFSETGERIGYVRTAFYETTLGQNPDLTL